MISNKSIRYSFEKSQLLKEQRDITFEDMILSIEEGNLLDDLEHPNKEKFPNQNIFKNYCSIKKIKQKIQSISLFIKDN